MRFINLFFVGLIIFSCSKDNGNVKNFKKVTIETILEDSLSIRAIELTATNELWFAANNGLYGRYTQENGMRMAAISYDSVLPSFRSIASNGENVFAMSILNPALLYKLTPKPELVYKEEHEKVFYDALKFWNEKEGIAIGDPTDDCLSIVITRDGGNSWEKLSCDILPTVIEGEAAFAASNTNIEIIGDKTWVVSGGKQSRVFYSPDKGESWEVYDTPIVQGIETQGIYSVDFYDEMHGFVIGGDYTKPDDNTKNKASTKDGGKSWDIISDKKGPGYKSCIQYVPGSEGKAVIAIGFTGISFSNDAGKHWKKLSDEGFYTIKFVNDSVAYAAGNKRIARLTFTE